ncbi:MAG: cyclopropane fatty acyl phospholipid synthase [Desulfobacterales bacterium]
MKTSGAKQLIQELLEPAGIKIDGTEPFDIQVHNPGFYLKVLAGGSLALGESYMDGWWDCVALDQFFYRVMRARLDRKVRAFRAALWAVLKTRLLQKTSRSKAFEIGRRHYDIGNDLFTVMLDRQMNYSCAYWKQADNLEVAQEAKLELICRKLMLEEGMRVLDIGCGWGGFAVYAAKNYGVEVVGITVSREQVKLARERIGELPISIELKDYRDLQERFDRIVSIGMFEHVGLPNYRKYMESVLGCLNSDGLFLLHTIGGNTSTNTTDPWIEKYIFPNSMLPSASQISDAAEGLFVMEDWHSFGHYYDSTLMAWYKNLTNNWDQLKSVYNERFYRMWIYYLLSCAGTFRARRNQLWQIVFSKKGLEGGYEAIR